MKKWRCRVCGYVHDGDNPPHACPACTASHKEFAPFSEYKKMEYNGKKFDVLLINGSAHRAHNTGVMCDIAEKTLKARKVSYRRINLNEHQIYHCWCCYSMKDNSCTYPCRNQHDDAPAMHEMLLQCKAVIVASPINWNGMSARLKDFLDRLTCIQNIVLLGKGTPCAGKTVGLLVNGHEDGAMKTAMDIYVYFQQMGFILAPFGFTYRTHGADNDAGTDNAFFAKDESLKRNVTAVVDNVVLTMRLGIDKKMGKIKGVCE